MYGVCYIEIPTTDMKKSGEFYSKVFNWKIEESDPDYLMFTTPDKQGGGFDKSQKPSKDGVLLYIEVENIEEKMKEIEAAGGKEEKGKTKISDEFGFYALFLDTSENIMGLWASK